MGDEAEVVGEISQEVVLTLVELMTKTIGPSAMSVVLKRLDNDDSLEGQALVMACAEEVENVFGSQGAYAILRQVGRDLSNQLAEGVAEQEYRSILTGALNSMGFAKGIDLFEGHANICSCVFYDKIKQVNRSPIDHPVCWAGWGFIEGFMKKINGTHHVQWEGRDEKACRFKFYSSLTE